MRTIIEAVGLAGLLTATALGAVLVAAGGIEPVGEVGLNGAETVMAGVVIAFVVGVLVWARKPFRPGEVEVWLDRRGVPISAATVERGDDLIRRSRTVRAVGTLLFLLLGFLPAGLHNFTGDGSLLDALPSAGAVTSIPLGYLLAVLLGEVLPGWLASRREPGAPRQALLAPRESAAYLDWLAIHGPRIAMGAAGALLVVHLLVGAANPAVGSFVIGAVILAMVEGGRRVVIDRRQEVQRDDLLRLDDVARASTAFALSGSGIACLLGAFSDVSGALVAGTASSILSWTLGPLALLAVPAGVGIWLGMGTGAPFTVRRQLESTS